MVDMLAFTHLAQVLSPQALILPYAGAPFGLGIDPVTHQWEVRTVDGQHHRSLPADLPLAAALQTVHTLCSPPHATAPAGAPPRTDAQMGERGLRSAAPAPLDLQTIGRVWWTRPLYDGQAETWRPRGRMQIDYPTIAAFLAAKQTEGWECETFPEVATTEAGVAYPVVAVSLTRTRFGGSPQDDLLHVWVEPAPLPHVTEGEGTGPVS